MQHRAVHWIGVNAELPLGVFRDHCRESTDVRRGADCDRSAHVDIYDAPHNLAIRRPRIGPVESQRATDGRGLGGHAGLSVPV